MKEQKEAPLSAALPDGELSSAVGGIDVPAQELSGIPRVIGDDPFVRIEPFENPDAFRPFWLRDPGDPRGKVEVGGMMPDGFRLDADGRWRED